MKADTHDMMAHGYDCSVQHKGNELLVQDTRGDDRTSKDLRFGTGFKLYNGRS